MAEVILRTTSTGQPHGFGPTSSVYAHDANGNLTADDGKGLTIHYNLLNLPDSIGKVAIIVER